MGGCGINAVNLLGSLNDWKLLKSKIESLKKYGDNFSYFKDWIDALVIISDNFISTYEGKEECRNFWMKVFDEDKKFVNQSGIVAPYEEISGWIKYFFLYNNVNELRFKDKIHEKLNMHSISRSIAQAPI